MRCLRTIVAASACLGIMPGVVSTPPHTQAYVTVGGAWLVLFASTQRIAAWFSHMPEAVRRPALGLRQRDQEILTFSPVAGVQEFLQKLWTGACNPAAADSHSVGGQSE